MPTGAVRDCGDDEYPGIYVRLDHPSNMGFIRSVIWQPKGIGKKKYIFGKNEEAGSDIECSFPVVI